MKRLAFLPVIMLTLPAAMCQPKEVPVLILPPAELAVCAEDEAAPDLPAIDWASVQTAMPIVKERGRLTLEYILSLKTTGGDCRAKVKGLATWREEAQAD